MPCTNTSARPALTASSAFRSISDPPIEACPKCGRARSASCSRRPPSSSRGAGSTSPTTPKSGSDSDGGRADRSRIRSRGRQVLRRSRRQQVVRREVVRRQVIGQRNGRQDRVEAEPRRPNPTDAERIRMRQRRVYVGDLRDSVRFSGLLTLGADGAEVDAAQVVAELVGEVRPAQREVHDRLQESELVAGVVADAVDLAAVDRALTSAAAAARWSAESRRSDRVAVSSSAGKISGVRM